MTLNDTKTHPILTNTTPSTYRTIVNNKVQNGAACGIAVDNAKKEPPLRSGSKVNREASIQPQNLRPGRPDDWTAGRMAGDD
jgi:hypothetical protein